MCSSYTCSEPAESAPAGEYGADVGVAVDLVTESATTDVGATVCSGKSSSVGSGVERASGAVSVVGSVGDGTSVSLGGIGDMLQEGYGKQQRGAFHRYHAGDWAGIPRLSSSSWV